MEKLCVPYKDTELSDPKYRLYTVDMYERNEIPVWNLRIPYGGKIEREIIDKKFKGLQRYYRNHYRSKYRAEFELKTLISQNNINSEYAKILDKETTSVFLGIFLKAGLQIIERKFKENWEILCISGDLDYIEPDEILCLVPVADIINKYKDEFEKEAEKISDGKCLFLYISDKEEIPEGEKQGKHGNTTIKRFSPNNTIDDIHDYLFNSFSMPVQQKVNLNMLSDVAILKRYIAKSFIENSDSINDLEDIFVLFKDTDIYDDLACFEGYISASLCLLYLIEEFICNIKDRIQPKEDDNQYASIMFLRFMGTFNKIQRQTASYNNIVTDFDNDNVFDEFWDSDLKELPKKMHDKVSSFCPSMQQQLFYAAWNRFCILFCRVLVETNIDKCDLLFSPSKIKDKILFSMDYCLDKYLEKKHYVQFVFWAIIPDFLGCEFELEGFEELEIKYDLIHKKKNWGSWREHFRKELNLNKNDKLNIRNIMSSFKNQRIALRIAAISLFGKTY